MTMAAAGPESLAAERHAFPTEEALQEDYHARGWTDGLPIVAPTPERVAQFLAAADLAPDTLLGEVATREVRVTAEHAAINAVMAGCRPEAPARCPRGDFRIKDVPHRANKKIKRADPTAYS